MFRGIFLGMVLMAGGVFAADSMATDAGQRPIVNWDVAVARSVEAANFVRVHVARLIEQAQAAPAARGSDNAY